MDEATSCFDLIEEFYHKAGFLLHKRSPLTTDDGLKDEKLKVMHLIRLGECIGKIEVAQKIWFSLNLAFSLIHSNVLTVRVK